MMKLLASPRAVPVKGRKMLLSSARGAVLAWTLKPIPLPVGRLLATRAQPSEKVALLTMTARSI